MQGRPDRIELDLPLDFEQVEELLGQINTSMDESSIHDGNFRVTPGRGPNRIVIERKP